MVDEACAEAGIDPVTVERAGVSSCGPFVIRDGMVEVAAPNICGGIAGPGAGPAQRLANRLAGSPAAPALLAVAGGERRRRRPGGRAPLGRACRDSITAPTSPGAPASAWACAWTAACCAARTATPATPATCSSRTTTAQRFAAAAISATSRRWWRATRSRGASAPTRPRCCSRAKAGDAGAQATVDELCRVMGRALYNLIATLDLQRISLGGSVFWNNRDYLLPRLAGAGRRETSRAHRRQRAGGRRAGGPGRRLRGAGVAGL